MSIKVEEDDEYELGVIVPSKWTGFESKVADEEGRGAGVTVLPSSATSSAKISGRRTRRICFFFFPFIAAVPLIAVGADESIIISLE